MINVFWENYNNSLTWNKAMLGWFLLLTMIPVRSQWDPYNFPRCIGVYHFTKQISSNYISSLCHTPIHPSTWWRTASGYKPVLDRHPTLLSIYSWADKPLTGPSQLLGLWWRSVCIIPNIDVFVFFSVYPIINLKVGDGLLWWFWKWLIIGVPHYYWG